MCYDFEKAISIWTIAAGDKGFTGPTGTTCYEVSWHLQVHGRLWTRKIRELARSYSSYVNKTSTEVNWIKWLLGFQKSLCEGELHLKTAPRPFVRRRVILKNYISLERTPKVGNHGDGLDTVEYIN
jgi:hypothetical protein